jgi:hypothetical protein
VAGWQDVILGDEQLKAILANLAAFKSGDIGRLGDLYQKYMFDQFTGAGLDLKAMITQGAKTTQEELQGKIPSDVQAQVNQLAAQRGLTSGFGVIDPRDIAGQTSLSMIQAGQNSAQLWANIAKGTTLPSSSFLITPEEQFAATTQNRLQSQRVEQQKMNINAARDPIAGGLSDLVAYLTAAYISSGRSAGGGPQKVGASDYSAQTNVPAGGMGGSWAALTGQPYDQLGSATGANTTLQYNAVPFQTGAMSGVGTGVYNYVPPPTSYNAAPGYMNDQYGLPSGSVDPYGFNTSPYQYNIPPNPWG